jgi:hypothetical protein
MDKSTGCEWCEASLFKHIAILFLFNKTLIKDLFEREERLSVIVALAGNGQKSETA